MHSFCSHLSEKSLSRLNVWRSPAYVTRDKYLVSPEDQVKTFWLQITKNETNVWIIHNKIYNMHLVNSWIFISWRLQGLPTQSFIQVSSNPHLEMFINPLSSLCQWISLFRAVELVWICENWQQAVVYYRTAFWFWPFFWRLKIPSHKACNA